MKKLIALLVIANCVFASGCGSTFHTADQVATASFLSTDQYSKTTWFIGPFISNGGYSEDGYFYRLRTFYSDRGR